MDDTERLRLAGALLAKAGSSEYPEEIAAFLEKASELMASLEGPPPEPEPARPQYREIVVPFMGQWRTIRLPITDDDPVTQTASLAETIRRWQAMASW